jgi:hypothetical protein
LSELLSDLGVVLSTASKVAGKAHGILKLQNGQWEIVLPAEGGKGRPYLSPRERFTVAHEIGHIVLYHYGLRPPRDRREYWQVEDLCNLFAGQLLIAEHELVTAFPPERPIGPRELLLWTKRLAKTLSVSFEAAARRVTAHVDRSAIARVRIDSGSELTFVIEWSTESETWLKSGRGKRITPKHPLFGFVAQECAAQQPDVREVQLTPRAAMASQWTPVRLDFAARFTGALIGT